MKNIINNTDEIHLCSSYWTEIQEAPYHTPGTTTEFRDLGGTPEHRAPLLQSPNSLTNGLHSEFILCQCRRNARGESFPSQASLY